jgi:uncharacterized membrane protein
MNPIVIKSGAYTPIDFELTTENKLITFTITDPTVDPAVGDRYRDAAGIVYTISYHSTVTLRATSNSNENPALSSGTLTRISGSGDTSITYSAYTSTNYMDLNGVTLTLHVREKETDTADTATFTWDTHIIDEKGLTQYIVSETESDPDELPVNNYVAQLQIEGSNTATSLSDFTAFFVERGFKT